MARCFWRSGPDSERLEQEAGETLHRIELALEQLAQNKHIRGSPGLLETMLAHWELNRCNLSLAMNSMSAGDVLETAFSFQPDHVQIFVNTEGAYPEDVSVQFLPEEGGFDLEVQHKETRPGGGLRLAALRIVRRSYRLVRPLAWSQAEFSLLTQGILQILVPGPRLTIHPLPFQYLQSPPHAF